jgi:hypothetical protein
MEIAIVITTCGVTFLVAVGVAELWSCYLDGREAKAQRKPARRARIVPGRPTFIEATACLAERLPQGDPIEQFKTELPSFDEQPIGVPVRRPPRRRPQGLGRFFGDLACELGVRQEIRRMTSAIKRD